jgi:hypothetical protein
VKAAVCSALPTQLPLKSQLSRVSPMSPLQRVPDALPVLLQPLAVQHGDLPVQLDVPLSLAPMRLSRRSQMRPGRPSRRSLAGRRVQVARCCKRS